MFINVCIPNNNENEFIEIAKKLGTDALCFINSDKKDFNFKTFNGSFSKGKLIFEPIRKNISNKNRVYYYTSNKSKSFHYPSNLTQVTIKKIKELKSILLIPLYEVKEKNIEEIKFLIKISKKYKLKLGLACFAKNPYELKSKKDLISLAICLGMDTSQIDSCFSCLGDFCSAMFL